MQANFAQRVETAVHSLSLAAMRFVVLLNELNYCALIIFLT